MPPSPTHKTNYTVEALSLLTSRYSTPRTPKLFAAAASLTMAPMVAAASGTIAFSPLTLSGLVLWTRADKKITLSKSTVVGWGDLSGNGNDLTALAASAPTLLTSSANMPHGGASLLFSGAEKMNTGTGFSISQPNTIIAVVKPSALTGNAGIVDDATARQIGYIAASGPQWAGQASGGPIAGGTPNTSEHMVGWVFNGASSKIYVDGSAGVITGNAGTGGGTGGFIIGTQSTAYLSGEISEIMIFNRELTATEIDQLAAYVAAGHPSYTPPKSLIFNGNSIVYGDLASPITDGFAYLVAAKFPDANFLNDGKEGYTTPQCDTEAAAVGDLQYSPLRPNNVNVMNEVVNDYNTNGHDTAACITHLATYVTNRKAAGANKIVMCTCLPNYVMAEADRTTINAAIKSGATGADVIADIAADPVMGSYANITNPTYYVDQLHPSNTGHALIEPYVTAAVKSVW